MSVPVFLLALVDDEHRDRASAAVAATMPHARVRVAASLADACATIETETPDVVLCCRRFGGGRWRDVAALAERRAAASVFVLVLPEHDAAPDLTGTAVDELLWIRDVEWARLPLLARRWARSAAAQAALTAQERLALLLRAVKAETWEWDIAAGEVTWDDEGTGGGQRAPWTLERLACEERVLPEDLPRVRAALQRALADEDLYSVEYRLRTPAGTVRWMLARGHVVRSAAGDPLRMPGVSIDVTEFRETQEALASVQERNRLIAELATEAIFFYDEAMRVAFVNRAGLEMLGRPWDELQGVSIFDLVPADYRDRLDAELARRRAGHTDRLVFPATRGDGTRIWVQSSGRTILDRDGRRLGHLVVATDITERVHREERLQRALADRESLLREVHHRVRNNFQIIFSLLNLQFGDIGRSDFRDRVRDMQNRIMTMALLHSLLYQAEDVSAVNVDTYLDELLAVLRRSFEPGGTRIVTELDVPPLRLSLDACMRCGLIVNELVTNAFKHAFPGGRAGRVRVRLTRDPSDGTTGALALYVEDDGVGLAGEARVSPGALGLQLVEDMARQLDGRLEVSSEAGTRVCVTLTPGGFS